MRKACSATGLAQPVTGPANDALDTATVLPPPDANTVDRRDAVLLARRALRSLLTDAPMAAPHSRLVPSAAPVAAVAVLADRGPFWEVSYAGRAATVKASKGMADIARLIAAQGRDIHCLELMGAVADERPTDQAVDAQARTAYRQRIRDLQEQIDGADADGDLGRAERARLEMDTLVDHLTAALGLGGRARRSGGSAERARSAVTQRIRTTIRNMAVAHPELAAHLERSVVTGTYCSYRPESPVPWTTGPASDDALG